MKDFLKRYQTFITNLFMLACMLGSCFGAVIFIQDTPNKAITALAVTVKENDDALMQRMDEKLFMEREARLQLKAARDLEISGIKSDMKFEAASIRAVVRTEIDDVKKILERIEQRQYDQRKRALAPVVVPFGG